MDEGTRHVKFGGRSLRNNKCKDPKKGGYVTDMTKKTLNVNNLKSSIFSVIAESLMHLFCRRKIFIKCVGFRKH
jgi:hypothetical protein